MDIALVIDLRRRDDAEGAGTCRCIGRAEPGRVGEVEGFGAELERQPFLEREGLEERDVNLRRTARMVPLRIASLKEATT
ncbi:MAG TPA: hypothetical protein VI260_19060 [Blastocatellia bacterium]